MTPRLFPALCLALLLAACGTSPRYVVDSKPPLEVVRLPVGTMEVRDLVLPGHASGTEVLIETENGNLTEVDSAVWADDPVRALTATLARNLDIGSSATVAAEPWPLADPAQAEISVRVDRMLARADGRFELHAQVAVTSREGRIRERIERVSIATALPSPDAAGVAAATGTALQQLSARILSLLAI